MGRMEFKQVVFGSQLCASWLLELGDRVAFAGPSKSGKSLQLEILVGEVPIESGEQGFQILVACDFKGMILHTQLYDGIIYIIFIPHEIRIPPKKHQQEFIQGWYVRVLFPLPLGVSSHLVRG